MDEYRAQRGRISAGERDYATELAPAIQAAQQAIQSRVNLPAPPAAPQLKPPPSRKLTEFLSPVEGEAPEHSVSKMMLALGQLAMGLGVGGKRDARAALAAWSGALKGWHEGDKERADRSFADWQANTEKTLTQWKVDRAAFDDILKSADTAMEDKFRLINLLKLQHEIKAAPDVVDAATLEKFIGWQLEPSQQAAQVEHWKAQVEAMREAKREAAEYHAEHLRIERLKLETQIKQANDALNALGSQGLESLGQLWIAGKLPPGIARGPGAKTIMPRIIAAGTDWANRNGVNLQELPAIQAEMDGARKSIATNAPKFAFARAQVGTFERHIDQLVELGEKIDASQRPVVRRYQLMLRGEYEGDKDVAAYEMMTDEVGNEFAKVMVGTAQGDANTRASARDKFRSSLNPGQLGRVRDESKKAAHNRIEEWKASLAYDTNIINTLGGRKAAPEGAKGSESDARARGADYTFNEATGRLERVP